MTPDINTFLASFETLKISPKLYKETCQLISAFLNVPIFAVNLFEPPNKTLYLNENTESPNSSLECLLRTHFSVDSNEIFFIENIYNDERIKDSFSNTYEVDQRFMLIVPLFDSAVGHQGILFISDSIAIGGIKEKISGLKILANLLTSSIIEDKGKHNSDIIPSNLEFQRTSEDSPLVLNPTYYWKLDITTNTLHVSPHFLKTLGYSQNDLGADSLNHWHEAIHPSDTQKFHTWLEDWSENITDYMELEIRMLHTNGQVFWSYFEVNEIIKNEFDLPILILGEIHDISSQKKVWEQIDFLSPKLTSVIQAGYNWMSVIDNNGCITYLSSNTSLALGYSSEELQGMNYFDFVHDEERITVYNNFAKFLSHEAFITKPFRFKHKDGSWKWIEIILLNFSDDPEIDGIIVNAREATTIKPIDLRIYKTSEYQQFLFNTCSLPKYLLELDSYKILDVNNKMISHFDYSRDELLRMDALDLISKSERPYFIESINQVKYDKGVTEFGVFTCKGKTGSTTYFELVGLPISFKDRICLMISCNDVSTRETYLQDLKQSERRLKKVADTAKLGYYSYNLKTYSCSWSDEIYRIWGRSRESFNLCYENFLDTVHPDDQVRFINKEEQYITDPGLHNLTYRIILPDGSTKWVHAMGQLVLDQYGNPKSIEGTIQDVTDQKNDEQQLRLLESVVTNTAEAVLIFEAIPIGEYGRRVTFVNQAFVTMTGYSRKEILGKPLSLWKGLYLTSTERKEMGKLVANGKAFDVTVRGKSKIGEDYWMNLVVNPIPDINGKHTHWVAIARDVTEMQDLQLHNRILSKIGSMFHEEVILESCLKNVLQYLIEVTNYNVGQVWLPSPHINAMSLFTQIVSNNTTQSFLKIMNNLETCKVGEGLPGIVWENQELMTWDSIDKETAFERDPSNDIRSLHEVVGIPLMQKDNVTGILVLGKEKCNRSPISYGKLFEQLTFKLGSDITRRQLEIELDEIFSFTPAILCKADNEGIFRKVNPAVHQVLGYSEEEVLRKNIMEFIHPEDRSCTGEMLNELKCGKPVRNFENRYLTKDGTTKWISWSANRTQEKGIVYAAGTDITEKKALEEVLSEINELARIGTWELNLEQGTVYWSEMAKKIHEVDNNYQPDFETIHSFYECLGDSKVISEIIQNPNKLDKAFDVELPIVTAKGKIKWVRAIGKRDFFDGQCIRMFGSIQDIDQLKTTQLKFLRTKEEKNAILESVGDAFLSLSPDGIVTYWNKKAEDSFKIKREKVLGSSIEDVFSQFIDPKLYKSINYSIKTKKKYILEEYFPDYDKWFEINVYPADYGTSIFIKDVSEKVLAAKEIKLTNERFAKVAQATTDVIWDWNVEENLLFLSDTFKSLFGHELKTENKNLQLWSDNLHPEDKARVIDSLYKVVEDTENNINIWETEYRFLNASREYSYVLDKGIVIRDQEGKAIRLIGAMTDISFRKNYEKSLQQLNRKLEERTRNVEAQNRILKDIAWTQSHTVRAPLARLMLLANLIRDGIVAEEEVADLLDKIWISANELDSIIKDIINKSQSLKSVEQKS